MTLRQVKAYSLAIWRRKQGNYRMQLFIARAAQADDKAYQQVLELLDARSADTKV